MADVNISTSDDLGVIIGKWIRMITPSGDKIGVEGDLYLKESDGSNSAIPVNNDSIQLQKSDAQYDLINLTQAELYSLKAKIFTTDFINTIVSDTSGVAVLISSSDTLDLAIVDAVGSGAPFVLNNPPENVWSFKKIDDQWILNTEKRDWQYVVEKYEWASQVQDDYWTSRAKDDTWTLEKEEEFWSDKKMPEVWVLSKFDDTWKFKK
jgi:hypothetical protein